MKFKQPGENIECYLQVSNALFLSHVSEWYHALVGKSFDSNTNDEYAGGGNSMLDW